MTLTPQGEALLAVLRAGLSGLKGGAAGLAVSGGGDSVALMHLCAAAGISAEVATVDHGLRPEAADEARMVAARAAALGFAHATLLWDGARASGNLPDAARLARRELLADWARQRGLSAVVLAHTLDDVAETFLMRLARGAGVDGLSAMASRFHLSGVLFLRPLLSVSRQDLRDWLIAQSLPWADDPTNSDQKYDRARARKALAALAPLGLDTSRLAEVAGHMADARAALEAATDALLRQSVTVVGAGLALRLDPQALRDAPHEIRRRALVAAILWLAPGPYAPRGAQVETLALRLGAGRPSQLAGARFFWRKAELWACREPSAGLEGWTFNRPAPDLTHDLALRPLGAEGLAQSPDWRGTGLPRTVLLTAPALWHGTKLVAAPHAGHGEGAEIRWSGPARPTAAPILSH